MSDNENLRTELFKLNIAINEKTNFMLLTATTASIAFVLTQMKGLIWTKLIYLPIGSLILLGLSFLFGCRAISHLAKMLKINAMALQDEIPIYRSRAAFNQIYNLLVKINYSEILQQLTFFSGALVYAIYIFLDIYLKSHPQ